MTPEPAVVCFAGQDWWYHNRAHSDFQLMRRIAKSRPVLLVNSMGLRMPVPGKSTQFTRRVVRKLRSAMRRVCAPLEGVPNYHVMTPLFLPVYSDGWLRARNVAFVRGQVERVMRRLGMERPHVFVTLPTSWDIVRNMERASLIYNRSDNHSAFPEAHSSVVTLERTMLEQADLVTYASRAFLEAEREIVGDRGRFVDHGVELSHFRVRPEPSVRLADIPRPIVGFFGSLDDYLVDFELLERVAREIPDASLVLIGDATLSLERLEQLPNVYSTGFVPYEEIPACGRAFDVALMPWLRNDWIRYCNPIKLKEYIALGLNVVTTAFDEAEYYRDCMHVADGHEAFVAMTRAALDGKLPAKAEAAEAMLESADWDDRAAELLAVMDETAAVGA